MKPASRQAGPVLTGAQLRELRRLSLPVWKGYADAGLTAHPWLFVDQRSCAALERHGLAEVVIQRRMQRNGTPGNLVECWRLTDAGRTALSIDRDGERADG